MAFVSRRLLATDTLFSMRDEFDTPGLDVVIDSASESSVPVESSKSARTLEGETDAKCLMGLMAFGSSRCTPELLGRLEFPLDALCSVTTVFPGTTTSCSGSVEFISLRDGSIPHLLVDLCVRGRYLLCCFSVRFIYDTAIFGGY